MKKLVMLTLCFGMVCTLLADANTDTYTPVKNTELPTNAAPIQLQKSDTRRVPDSRVLLYAQIPTNAANSYACQWDSVYPFEADLVEDVTPSADWTVDSIVGYARPWGSWVGWSLVPNVRFLVYADSSIGSHPVDSPFVEIIVDQGTYETTAYGSGWLVGLPLPSSVVLSAGVTYWLEVVPNFSFAANGQSGTMAEPGIGNGVEFFYRFPLLGTPVFAPASAGGWTGCEGGIELYGSAGGTLVDAATTAILSPPATVMPGTVHAPEATYRNNGTSSATFDCYFTIDSSGTNIYSQTANITLGSATDTTITWPNWTAGPADGPVYDVTAWVVLAGDENPANDTLTATITIASVSWKTYASMPQASYYNAVVYSDVTGVQTVWSVGGNPTYTSIFEFDCATESWSTSSAVLNHEAQRTAAAVCMGRVYIMGGCNAGFTAHSYAQAFDPVAGTVSDVTPLPTARYFNGALTWNDTLIYVIGGQSSSYHNVVEIYDPANDAWTPGTAMPIQNRSFSCGIQNDTIYMAGGYNGGGYITGSYIGVIDPGNPQSITWTAIANIPTGPSGTPGRSRLQGACVETPAGWRFYFTCGDDHGVAAYDTWFYDPNTTAWVQTLDKTTPISNSQCAVYVPNPFDHGTFFCAGGYNTASAAATAATEGLINIGTGIQEKPQYEQFAGFGFAAMANPSKGMISYATSVSGRVTLKAYDATGRLVETLVNTVQPAGVKTVNWDTNNIADGVYFLKLDVQGETATHKMILVK